MPGCKDKDQLFSKHSNTNSSSPSKTYEVSREPILPSLREYAVDAFHDEGIDSKCQDISDDQFCTAGIVLQPGNYSKSYIFVIISVTHVGCCFELFRFFFTRKVVLNHDRKPLSQYDTIQKGKFI